MTDGASLDERKMPEEPKENKMAITAGARVSTRQALNPSATTTAPLLMLLTTADYKYEQLLLR